MTTKKRWMAGLAACLSAALMLAACGGGGSGPGPAPTGVSGLVLIDVSVGSDAGVPLNRIVKFEFSEDLDPDSVRPDTIRIRKGPNYGKQVPGYFEVDGNVVTFFPRLPVKPDLSDAGFQPGTAYRITLPGSPDVATVRSFVNDRLESKTQVDFQTANVGSEHLFVDNFLDPLPPAVEFVNPPAGATEVPADNSIVLTMNRRPLDPATLTASNVTLTMVERQGKTVERPVSGAPLLVQSHDSVTVEFVPTYPLADQATYRLEVNRRVQDLVGNDLEAWHSTFSVRDEPPRSTAVVLEFDAQDKAQFMDATATTASWNEAEPDALAALFTVAGGNGTAGDLTPTVNENFSPSDFPRGVDTVVENGVETDVYNFRSIDIPQGVSVRFQGGSENRPVKLLSLKNIRIDGVLAVNGGRGEDASQKTGGSKLFLAKGGAGGPGGGDGADNYTGSALSKAPAQDGEDVTYGGGGGHGGRVTGDTYHSTHGGGGGGGGSREAGRDGKDGGYSTTSWDGKGGKGGLSTTARGYPLNLERKPNVGGAGGGAGALAYHYHGSSSDYRYSAASGGGGGGALILQGAGEIVIGATGRIDADGGAGGDIRSYDYGGAGGGGGGGSILVRATASLSLEAGATLSVAGGKGGAYNNTYTYYKGGQGGDGGDGYIRLEARENENSPGTPLVSGISSAKLTYGPVSTGTFAPRGGGAPSVGQTLWMNLGVFDPTMKKPSVTDIVSTVYNDQIHIEVQMAVEDRSNLGQPDLAALDLTDSDGDGEYDDSLDPSRLSDWTPLPDIESLNGNGYQFLRVRVVFQLDPDQGPDDPLPYLERLRIPFQF